MELEERIIDLKEFEFSNESVPPFLSSSISSFSSTDLKDTLNIFPEAEYFKQILSSLTINDMSLFN
jgi:hypothetical protein